MTPGRGPWARLLALAAGACAVFAFAPFGLSVAGVAALATLFFLWQSAPTARDGAWLGFAFGFGLFGAKHIPGYHESLEDYARLAGMKPAVFVDLVGRFYEIHRRQISYCLRWLNALVPLPPLDAATESMWKDGAAVVATLRDPKRLRRRFTPPPPDPSGKSYTAEQLARHFAQSVVNTLSSVH